MMSTDHRTDVYALGVILYRMLTGEVPFTAETFPMLIVQIVTTDAPSVLALRPDLPTAVDEIIARALARDVRDRYQSVSELSRALKPYREVEDVPRKVAPVPKTRLSLEGTLPSKRTPKLGALPERSSNVPTNIGRPGAGRPRANDATMPAVDGAGDTEPPAPPTGTTQMEADLQGRAAWKKPALGLVALLAVGGVAFALVGRDTSGGSVTPDVEDPVRPITAPLPPTVPGQGGTTPDAPPTAGNGAPAPEVRVRLAVQPVGARIFLNDSEYPNPLDSPRPRSLEPVRLRMELEGHETIERMIVFDTDARLEITLQPSATRPRTGSGGSATSGMRSEPGDSSMTTTTPPPRMDGFRESFD